jgi:hypothetical protein
METTLEGKTLGKIVNAVTKVQLLRSLHVIQKQQMNNAKTAHNAVTMNQHCSTW